MNGTPPQILVESGTGLKKIIIKPLPGQILVRELQKQREKSLNYSRPHLHVLDRSLETAVKLNDVRQNQFYRTLTDINKQDFKFLRHISGHKNSPNV